MSVCVRCGFDLLGCAAWSLVVTPAGEVRAVYHDESAPVSPSGVGVYLTSAAASLAAYMLETPLCPTCTATTVRYRDGREDPPPAGPLFDDAPSGSVLYALGGIVSALVSAEHRDAFGRELPPSL